MEQFGIELAKILANIADTNTDPKKPRKITLTAIIKANEDREIATFEVQSKATLVPVRPISTTIIIDRNSDGKGSGGRVKVRNQGSDFYRF